MHNSHNIANIANLKPYNRKNMVLNVLICTLDKGILHIPEMLLSERKDVEYIVSWQYTDKHILSMLPQELQSRPDVHVWTLPGKGLSRNRNNALSHATGDICLTADDDMRYCDAYFDTILDTFRQHPEVDIAQFRAQGYDGKWQKTYPPKSYRYNPNDLNCIYPSSIELAMKRSVWERGLRFNPLFGLGADYLHAGEEEILLLEAYHKKMEIRYFPFCIAQSDPISTGMFFTSRPGVQRAKGAVFYKRFGLWNALYRTVREGLSWCIRKRNNPFSIWWHMLQGIAYICKQEQAANSTTTQTGNHHPAAEV